jgi:hypothetical protein
MTAETFTIIDWSRIPKAVGGKAIPEPIDTKGLPRRIAFEINEEIIWGRNLAFAHAVVNCEDNIPYVLVDDTGKVLETEDDPQSDWPTQSDEVDAEARSLVDSCASFIDLHSFDKLEFGIWRQHCQRAGDSTEWDDECRESDVDHIEIDSYDRLLEEITAALATLSVPARDKNALYRRDVAETMLDEIGSFYAGQFSPATEDAEIFLLFAEGDCRFIEPNIWAWGDLKTGKSDDEKIEEATRKAYFTAYEQLRIATSEEAYAKWKQERQI